MKLFYWLRVTYKQIKKRSKLINSFCKQCGRDNHDFVVDNETWNLVAPLIRNGSVLCYDCFVEKCDEAGLPVVWNLSAELLEGTLWQLG